MEKPKKIAGGIYLVLNPAIERDILLEKLQQALDGGVNVLQVWNNWPQNFTADKKTTLINDILEIAEKYNVPVLINEEWQMLMQSRIDGVHFDKIPEDFHAIQAEAGREFIAGITCGNDLEVIRWAEKNQLDYVSFCSMFPSGSVDSCEIVTSDTVRKARELTSMPIFLSGGITTENIHILKNLDFNGIAVISGILSTEEPAVSAKNYSQALKNL